MIPEQFLPWEQIEVSQRKKIEQGIIAGTLPLYCNYPSTVDALAETVKYAAKQNWSILSCGSASKITWGRLVQATQLVISTSLLNRLVEHAVDDLTVTVEAGMKLSELQKILCSRGQFLPLDPSYPQMATIGGIIATADAGSWRQRYGGVRDLVLGISFVRADGEQAKGGGRVVKNVAGYDLMKLFTGSYGTLGIISQVTLRVYPLPDASQTVFISGNDSDIATFGQKLLNTGLTPSAADYLSAAVVKYLQLGESMGLAVRFQSIPESVKEQTKQLEVMAKSFNLQVNYFREDEENNLWEKLQQIVAPLGENTAISCKIGVLPNRVVTTIQQLEKLTATGLAIINLNSGLGKVCFERKNALAIITNLRSTCEINRGFLSILAGPNSIKQQIDPWGFQGNSSELMRKIKQQFDPKNLLNPGRFFEN